MPRTQLAQERKGNGGGSQAGRVTGVEWSPQGNADRGDELGRPECSQAQPASEVRGQDGVLSRRKCEWRKRAQFAQDVRYKGDCRQEGRGEWVREVRGER